LIRALVAAREYRHHDEPAIRQLIVADYGVAIVVRFARAAEALEQDVRRDRAVDDLAVLPEDRHSCVDDLEDVVPSHGKRVVGGVTYFPVTVRALETDT